MGAGVPANKAPPSDCQAFDAVERLVSPASWMRIKSWVDAEEDWVGGGVTRDGVDDARWRSSRPCTCTTGDDDLGIRCLRLRVFAPGASLLRLLRPALLQSGNSRA